MCLVLICQRETKHQIFTTDAKWSNSSPRTGHVWMPMYYCKVRSNTYRELMSSLIVAPGNAGKLETDAVTVTLWWLSSGTSYQLEMAFFTDRSGFIETIVCIPAVLSFTFGMTNIICLFLDGRKRYFLSRSCLTINKVRNHRFSHYQCILIFKTTKS